jgi:hypothetical protein
MFMRICDRLWLCAAVLAATGCGHHPAVPDDAVAGQWSYAATDVPYGSMRCAFSDVTVTLTQQGSLIAGFASGGTISCDGGPRQPIQNDATINQGSFNSPRLFFTIGPEFKHSGDLNGNRVEGVTSSLDGATEGDGHFTMRRK